MCGICGQLNLDSGFPVEASTIREMTRAIAHRGPDDEGYFIAGALALGFRRLSIIDLSLGHQPMSDAEESTVVVFNGEIYNFVELRRELSGRGHVFRTQSDTEVIVHGYKAWGLELFSKLNGMFGLGIWDVRRQRLVLARDAMGIKPLYYSIENGALFFASEIKAILRGLSSAPEVDVSAIHLFLRYRYTPAPWTMFAQVRKLAAGEMLVVEHGKASRRLWYDFQPKTILPSPSAREAEEELFTLYREAVRRQLISDVPVGLLLSGGVDSGLLLGLMNLQGDSWRTYSVGYGAAFKDDELSDAAETASLFGARHASIEIDRRDFEKTLAAVVEVLEEPVASSSIVPMYFICKRAREDVKVALIGQGPDELFGGYVRHLGIFYGRYWRMVPGAWRSLLKGVANKVPRLAAVNRGLFSLDVADRVARYQNVFSIMPGVSIDGLFHDGLLVNNTGDLIRESWRDSLPLFGGVDELGGFQLLELRSSLPDELLMYADKMSMAHGLEVRVPYLDRQIVEFAEQLDSGLKIRLGMRKWLHRRVSRRLLPQRILRRPKRGFGVNVVDSWFRQAFDSKMMEYLRDNESRIYRYLRHDAVSGYLKAHVSGEKDNHKLLFSIVVLEEWLRSALCERLGLSQR